VDEVLCRYHDIRLICFSHRKANTESYRGSWWPQFPFFGFEQARLSTDWGNTLKSRYQADVTSVLVRWPTLVLTLFNTPNEARS
jgi:hypothetical protein